MQSIVLTGLHAFVRSCEKQIRTIYGFSKNVVCSILLFCCSLPLVCFAYCEGPISQLKEVSNTHQLIYTANIDNDTISVLDHISNLPAKFFSKTNEKIAKLKNQLEKKSEKYLKKLLKQEAGMRSQLSHIDSNGVKNIFPAGVDTAYNSLIRRLRSDTTSIDSRGISGEYYPYIDSLQTELSYLAKNPQLLDGSKIAPGNIQSTLKNLLILESKMKDADQIKQFIEQRKEQLKQYLNSFLNLSPRILKTYQNYNKQLYYYSQQVKVYRETLNDPDKLMKLSLAVLNKIPAFSNFFKKNSILASIFNLSGTYVGSAPGQGLSTRDQVLATFQNQMTASGGPNVSSFVQQNVQSAQGQVDQIREKLLGSGGSGSADIDVPNFHPNDQKSKSFLKRLQLGTDLQTVHSSFFYPTTTDIALSVAYKLNDKNDVGVGASVKMGWGKDISHINITGQGAGLRSFLDINIKKSFYASGGFEYNYQSPIQLGSLPELKTWQQSGLMGITKKVSLKTKLLKSTKIQLLWDFLSYEQIPRAQPFKFRVGYSF